MKKNKFKSKKDDRPNSPFENRKKFCPFSQPGSPVIDYKDIRLLSRYITEKGKIIPSSSGKILMVISGKGSGKRPMKRLCP